MVCRVGKRRLVTLSQGVWRAPATNVAPFGDSISGQNYGSSPYQANGYLVAANALMGWPMTIIANGGVSGNTTTQMLARLDQFLSDNPSIGTVLILGGTNDPGASISSATTISNLQAMYALCRLRRVRPVALTIIPRTDQAGSLLAHIQAVNAVILASTGPVAIADTFTALADAGNSLLPYANALFDAVHPSAGGAMRMARDAIVAALAPLIAANTAAGTSDDLDYREYASNPMGAGDNADGTNGWRLNTGVTGTGPSGWSASRRNTGVGVASKSGAAARIVASFAANWDGVDFAVGGDDVLALGRYDQTWASSTAYAIGSRRRPTSLNGYHYRVIVGGTSGASQPTWPTTEGATVADGTVTWMCQRTPTAGDKFIATADVQFSDLTSGKWIAPRLFLGALRTTDNEKYSLGYSLAQQLGSSTDVGLDYAPAFMRLQTPEMTLGSDTMRYLLARISVYGQAGGGVTMDVLRASIRRTSP